MKQFSALVSILLMVCFSGSSVFADDPEPPLFVSSKGIDQDNCQNVIKPCASIEYALQRVGKNGQIRVGDGSFELTDVADVIYLLSGAIDVRGSYTNGSRSTLLGVPAEFATELKAKGFHVIVDSKGLASAAVQTQLRLKSNIAATECSGGFADAFPCNNVDLLSHIADRTPTARGADIWGYVDLNTNREYAIMGYSTGTAVFDISDPETPREVGFIDGQSTTWRDIKVYQFWNATDSRWNAHAYVSADNASDGLFIIDLSELPHDISRINYDSDFNQAHNVYLLDVDYATGLSITGDAPNLILAGSDNSDGRYRTYSLSNAAAPSFIAAPQTPAGQPLNDRLYMHDGASMVVTDSRKDTQCVNAAGQGHCDILFDFNESSADIWDVSEPQNPVRLSRFPYTNSRYTHSGWPSEDQQYLFIQDELDERDAGLPTTLRVLSIADLTAPTLAGTWSGPTGAIDHNGFARGNRYYMSNYTRGLTVLDITDPTNPTESGRFDTYPSSDATGFPGNWGVYPFLPSGNIALSDIDSGFYMVADKTLDVAEGTLSFSAPAFGADETQTIDLVVQRTGGTQGSVSVSWTAMAATASLGDITTTSGTLNWADGDASDQTINLALNNDGNSEGLEQILIKLIAPTGGATVSSPSMASAYISDPGASSSVQFSSSSLDILERGFGTAVAVVQRAGDAAGSISVDYAISASDATNGADFTGPSSGTLNWAAGDAGPQWIEYTIVDDGSGEGTEFFELSLSNPSNGSLGANSAFRVNIVDGAGTNSAPNSVAGGSQTVAAGTTVTLDGSGSNDPDGDSLSFSWSQTLGPTVALTNPTNISATFFAPTVASDTLYRFELQVTDPAGLANTSDTSVTVTGSGGSNAIPGNSRGGGGALSFLTLLALLSLSVASRKDAS